MTNNDNHKNFVIQSSFTQSTGNYSVLDHFYGSILFSSLNISDSKLDANAAFTSLQPFNLSTTNYSHFYNISSNTQCCFYHFSNYQNIFSCKFINNNVLRLIFDDN